jgi:hypothetical protein
MHRTRDFACVLADVPAGGHSLIGTSFASANTDPTVSILNCYGSFYYAANQDIRHLWHIECLSTWQAS